MTSQCGQSFFNMQPQRFFVAFNVKENNAYKQKFGIDDFRTFNQTGVTVLDKGVFGYPFPYAAQYNNQMGIPLGVVLVESDNYCTKMTYRGILFVANMLLKSFTVIREIPERELDVAYSSGLNMKIFVENQLRSPPGSWDPIIWIFNNQVASARSIRQSIQ
jgi:hypothetical protein